MTQRGLVIGYGSIGERHARVLERLGITVSIASRRNECGGRPVFSSFDAAQDSGPFDYIMVANETARHAETLARIAVAGHDGLVLVEKPLFSEKAHLPAHRFRRAAVGYNLRFHPVVQALRTALAGRRVQIANIYVGQHLDLWRPGRDVASSYSASRTAGGGALRDLSHELDLAAWLFGPWRRVAAMGGRLGAVTVDSDDGWGILLCCEVCPVVTMEMNYLDRPGRRTITVQTDGETLHADLMACALETAEGRQEFAVERDQTYATMHQAMFDGSSDLCTLEEGARAVELIEAIERSAHEQRWIERIAA
jgi:predicted dehydrogenase